MSKDDTEPSILEAPCLICGYNGPGYWRPGTHTPECPWHAIAGSERYPEFRRIVRERFAARSETASREEIATARDALYEILGQQHVLKYALSFIRRWRNDPNFNPDAEIERAEGHISEWHRRIVDACHKLDALVARTEIAPGTTEPVYLIEGKPHRECDCPRLESKCPMGHERAMQTTQFSRCLLPAEGVLIAGAATVEWIGGKITRADNFGLAYVEVTGRLYPFTFDRINGYRGERTKEIGLHEGRAVEVSIVNDKIDRVRLT